MSTNVNIANTILIAIHTFDANSKLENPELRLAVSCEKTLWLENPTAAEGEARAALMECVRERVNEALGLTEDRPKGYHTKRTQA